MHVMTCLTDRLVLDSQMSHSVCVCDGICVLAAVAAHIIYMFVNMLYFMLVSCFHLLVDCEC